MWDQQLFWASERAPPWTALERQAQKNTTYRDGQVTLGHSGQNSSIWLSHQMPQCSQAIMHRWLIFLQKSTNLLGNWGTLRCLSILGSMPDDNKHLDWLPGALPALMASPKFWSGNLACNLSVSPTTQKCWSPICVGWDGSLTGTLYRVVNKSCTTYLNVFYKDLQDITIFEKCANESSCCQL